MKKMIPRIFSSSRQRTGAVLALLCLLIMGMLGSWLIGAGLAAAFLAAGFAALPNRKTLSAVLPLVWMAGCAFLSCCYPSWMAEYRFFDIKPNLIVLNLACAWVVYGFFLLLIGRIRPAVTAASGTLLLLCIANTFVFQFRGSELQCADFLSLRTAINVAAGYAFHIPARMAGCVLLWVWTLFVGGLLPKGAIPPLRPPHSRRRCRNADCLCAVVRLEGRWRASGILEKGWDPV